MLYHQDLTNPTDKRIYAVASALYDSSNYTIERLAKLTRIDRWFLYKMDNIIKMIKELEKVNYKVRIIIYLFFFLFVLAPEC